MRIVPFVDICGIDGHQCLNLKVDSFY
jgi:hypothetical protein